MFSVHGCWVSTYGFIGGKGLGLGCVEGFESFQVILAVKGLSSRVCGAKA